MLQIHQQFIWRNTSPIIWSTTTLIHDCHLHKRDDVAVSLESCHHHVGGMECIDTPHNIVGVCTAYICCCTVSLLHLRSLQNAFAIHWTWNIDDHGMKVLCCVPNTNMLRCISSISSTKFRFLITTDSYYWNTLQLNDWHGSVLHFLFTFNLIFAKIGRTICRLICASIETHAYVRAWLDRVWRERQCNLN